MSSKFSHTSGLTKTIIIIEFVLVAYLVYSLTKNVYNSYQVDKYIETFKEENSRIAEENQPKTADYLYFTSEEYIDKIAKQNLGLVNAGEEVIILSAEALAEPDASEVEEADEFAKHIGKSNVQQWGEFFFGQ